MAADIREFWEAIRKTMKVVHDHVVAQMRSFPVQQQESLKVAMLDKVREMEVTGPDLGGPKGEVAAFESVMKEFGIDPRRRPKHGSAIAKAIDEQESDTPREAGGLMGWTASKAVGL